jgi:hypothetical protein
VDESEFFSMLRNKPLHGFTPAGVLTNANDVVAWGVGSTATHLAMGPKGILVDSVQLALDLCNSMDAFANVLDQNTEGVVVDVTSRLNPVSTKPPRDRWVRGFWARFCPIGHVKANWMTLGEASYGIPPA